MFKNKQIVRNFIFAFFCALILLISFTLTYYVTFFDEGKAIEENQKQIEKENQNEDVCSNNAKTGTTYFINSLMFKLMAAFFAGGILSDGLFIKMGII